MGLSISLCLVLVSNVEMALSFAAFMLATELFKLAAFLVLYSRFFIGGLIDFVLLGVGINDCLQACNVRLPRFLCLSRFTDFKHPNDGIVGIGRTIHVIMQRR